MDKIEIRRKRIINIVYLIIVLGIVYLFLRYCFWLFFPFMFAFFIAIIVQRPSNFIIRKTKLKKGFVATIIVLLLILVLLFLLSLLGVRLVNAGKSLVSFVTDKISDLPTLIENIKDWVVKTLSILPAGISSKLTLSATQWFDMIKEKSVTEIAELIVGKAAGSDKFSVSSLASPLSSIWSTAKQMPSVFIAVMISIVSSCFMAVDYDTLVNFIKNQLSDEHKEKLSRSKHIVFKSIGKILRSYLLIICITGAELFVGLNVLSLIGLYKSGHIIAISIIVALLDILPVIGTGTFMVPWAIYSLIVGEFGLGIGLFIVYSIIYVVREIIEPKIVGGTVGLPPFVTLMGMYIGSQLFGFIGIFLMPILIILIKLLNDEGIIHLWKPSKKEESEITSFEESADINAAPKKKTKFSFEKFKKKK
jgi:sporulation integral membrane protein YtvI